MHPNPQLHPLAVLIGEWEMRGSHPMLPGRDLCGRATFEWIERGAFLLVRTHMDAPEIPDGVAIFGTDDERPSAGTLIYFDVRNVSREYHWTFVDGVLTYTRTASAQSQRMRLEITERRIVATGEMSKNGGAWEPDLELTYTR